MRELKIEGPDAERASRELVKRLAERAAKRDDIDGMAELLLTADRRRVELLVAAVHAMADRATGEDLDALLADALALEEQYDDHDAATAAKSALVRLGMSALEAENVVNDSADRGRGRTAGVAATRGVR